MDSCGVPYSLTAVVSFVGYGGLVTMLSGQGQLDGWVMRGAWTVLRGRGGVWYSRVWFVM